LASYNQMPLEILQDERGFCRCGQRIMDQYRPKYNACRFPELCQPLREREYAHALRLAGQAGLARGLAML